MPIGEATKAARVPFTRIPDAVLLDEHLTPIQFRIYVVIARRADRESASAFPSYNTIAQDANISRRSAINGVKALVKAGYLAKRPQESGQGDATSNLYTISGEGSEIFALRSVPSGKVVQSLHYVSPGIEPKAVQNLHHGSAENAPQVVQNLHQGSANAAPELDSKNKKKSNKTQENRIAPAHTHEASAAAAAAADPELQALFADFQENIGALTAMAKQVIGELVAEHSTDQIRKAIQEAVIYEKRSLAYVRRVLHAWKRDVQAAERIVFSKPSCSTSKSEPATEINSVSDLCWPPSDLDKDLPTASDTNDPAMVAWNAISDRLLQLGRLTRLVTPVGLVGHVLTVRVSDERTYSVLTDTQRHLVAHAVQSVLGEKALLHVELVGRKTSAA
ncbi:MAG: helix-turn-helix domain-containing protein [Chloroflexi bacterium]|nr:helix-turn-helix domain-containing protein [Chloroflexota bacterium]